MNPVKKSGIRQDGRLPWMQNPPEDNMLPLEVLEGEYVTKPCPPLMVGHFLRDNIPRGTMAVDQMRSIIETNFSDSMLAIAHSPAFDQLIDRVPQPQCKHTGFAPAKTHNTKYDGQGGAYGPRPVKSAAIRCSPLDWEKIKPELERLYLTLGYSQRRVVEEMALQGSTLSLPAFKRKCKKWGWETYRGSGSRKRLHKPEKRSQNGAGKNHTSRIESVDIASPIQSSPGTVVALGQMDLILAPSSSRLPAKFNHSRYHCTHDALIRSVEQLYITHLPKWKVHNHLHVEEDEHDDLLVGIGVSLCCLEESNNSFAHQGIHKAFHTLRKVVGTKKSEDCGFFSLPAILQAYLKLRKHNELIMAKFFLLRAIKYAKQKFNLGHPFVRVLVYLQRLRRIQELQEDQESRQVHTLQYLEALMQANFQELQIVIFHAYWTCIKVTKRLGNHNMSYLQLWGDFVAYGDESSARDLLDHIQQAVRHCDEQNREYDDYTMTLLGMNLYVLQTTPSMINEAEATALDMVRRLDKRVAETGKELEGDMLITWKDLRHTLGNFHHARKEYRTATMYLEIYLEKGVEDERDLFALKRLEEWYSDLGDPTEVARVREWRLCEEKKQMAGVIIETFSNEDLEESDQGTLGSDDGNLSNEETVVGELEQHHVFKAGMCAVSENGMAEREAVY